MSRSFEEIREEHLGVIRQLGSCDEVIQRVAGKMIECLRAGVTIFFMGNGGSAADSQHLAAEFVNRGRTYRAIAHRSESGRIKYYTQGGMSMRRTFLRSPVKFSRISSRYTRGRYHPILKRWRAHKGVDYAANTGTRVRTTAKGRVLFKGRKGGYGNYVKLQHADAFLKLDACGPALINNRMHRLDLSDDPVEFSLAKKA